MTSQERIKRAYEHKEADRIPIEDAPWRGTLKRWHEEGMPDVDWRAYFDVDRVESFRINISPRYEQKILEETPRYTIFTNEWGATIKRFNELDATPEMLDFKITSAEAWLEAKKKMTLEADRIPWDYLKYCYPKWRETGTWVRGVFWYGFDVTHSNATGLENMLIAMMEEPEIVKDIFETEVSHLEILFDRAWDAGYHFDEVFWYDDMGYKGTTFFSPATYRELLKPYHKRTVDWAHNHGVYAQLHSCGNIMTLVDDLMEIGIDGLNPLEVKAGMDPIKLKHDFGDRLLLKGGTNAQHWDNFDVIREEIAATVPTLMQNGGYIFSTDHSIPNSVSFGTMKKIIAYVKEIGTYR